MIDKKTQKKLFSPHILDLAGYSLRRYWLWMPMVLLLTSCTTMLAPSTPQPATEIETLSNPVIGTTISDNPIPVLAYYYIWFDVKSWDRAKTDYPLLGRYSSDDADVMRQHIHWAKAAGIDGFIVSWKSTEKLNHRLDQLVEISNEENFKLAIIYQGLDFERNPLSINKIDADLIYFIERYATHPVFDVFGKPVVIWSGSWKFSTQEIQSVTESKRDRVLILASEKNVEGYERLADLVDGNAYYWSSVNPATHPGYLEKLEAMGKVIRDNGGLWIAPAAVGFDARLIGGTTVVDRQDGETLRIEMGTAFQSSPDAIGLISWNEFSENSHIEPSQAYGNRYLIVLNEFDTTLAPTVNDFDSSSPTGLSLNNTNRLVALFFLSALIIVSLRIIAVRAAKGKV